MAEALTEVEKLCQQSLLALENLPRALPGTQGDLRKRIQALLPRIEESKKKIMVRSARGQELTKAILHKASQLYEVASRTSNSEEAGDAVAARLKDVEDSVQNLTIYWKSFEYATT